MALDPVQIFISYAHEDDELVKKIAKHLRSMNVSVWSDLAIKPGAAWNAEIERNLDAADIILLMLSVDFLDSEFVRQKEIPRALERHDAGEAAVVPVLLREVEWTQNPGMRDLQAIPSDERWVTGGAWQNPDQAHREVARAIKGLVDEITNERVQKLAMAEQAREAYRREVAEALSDEHISTLERVTLDEMRRRLGISDEDAEDIEQGELQSIEEKRRNLASFEVSIELAVREHGYPFDDPTRAEVRKRQAKLGLQDNEITGIEEEVVGRLLAELAATEERRQEAVTVSKTSTAEAPPPPESRPPVLEPPPQAGGAEPPLLGPTTEAPEERDVSTPEAPAIVVREAAHCDHRAPITAAALSGDGRWVVTAGTDARIVVWSSDSGAPTVTWTLAQPAIGVAVNRDGSRVTAATGSGCAVFARDSGRQLAMLAPCGDDRSYVRAVAFSPDGTLLVAGNDSGFIEAWSTATWRGAAKRKPGRLAQAIVSLRFHPAGGRVVVGTYSGAVWLWDVATSQRFDLPAVSTTSPVVSAAYLTDDHIVWVADAGGKVVVADALSGQVKAVIPTGHPISAADAGPDGTVLCAGQDQLIRGWTLDGRQIIEERARGDVTTVRYSSNGRGILTAGSSGIASLWVVQT